MNICKPCQLTEQHPTFISEVEKMLKYLWAAKMP